MALFQNSVLKKYLQQQDNLKLGQVYQKFISFFQDTAIQQNIRESKEEQFQEGFLRELFVKVLGYTLNPEPDYNLTTEFKNQTGAKKADGAILKDGKALGVIELKSTKTRDLEAVRQQAFDYKANQQSCVYVITSNFEKLRFYINNAVEFEEFDLFNITAERFELLYLCLAKDSLLNNLPLKIKEASILEEDAISKKFYVDYSLFKRELYSDIVQRNLKIPDLQGLEENQIKKFLLKKTQKLLDRLLFILFSEDKGLLPPNSISKILEQWLKLKELDDYKSLYSRFIKYFSYLNTGWKGKEYEIYAYNGGLFLQDSILDNLTIDDKLLYKQTERLTAYDFESEVDVNILGHIFEHSLAEIENITALLEGREVEKSKTKRKKEGIFYTPKYITKYIVDNTVGKLCEEKKTELVIVEEDFNPKRRKETKKNLKRILDKYRNWLLELTILDPACGSGAFLNQALVFLISEHHYIDELYAQLYGSSIVFQDIENQILENNIYGVDINEESVDIARLSLWLRTAQKGRKLTTLNNNIKCGNSLIDDPDVAGDKAFKWEKEFPDVFAKGGFDLIIGNPPYGILIDEREEEYYKANFPLTRYKINLYILFIERMFQVFHKGIVHFIIPKSLLFNTYFAEIRKVLLIKSKIHEIFMLAEKVFADAEVGGSLILQFEISETDNTKNKVRLISSNTYFEYELHNCIINDIEQEYFLSTPNYEISPISEGSTEIIKKLISINPIKSYYDLKNGLNPGNIKHILISKKKNSANHKPIVWGKEFHNYVIDWGGEYVYYNPNIRDKLTLDDVKSKEGMKIQNRIDFALRTPEIFECKKLLVRKTGDRFVVAKDNNNLYFDTLVHGIYQKDEKFTLEYLLAVLNSKPATRFYRFLHDIKGKVFAKISLDKLAAFPLPTGTPEQRKEFSNRAIMLEASFYKKNALKKLFLNYISKTLVIKKIGSKLQNWHELEFGEFIKELNRVIKKAGGERLTKKGEIEWMELFEDYKLQVQQLQSEIDKTEREIDQMVYELYGLTDEEIKIVEGR